LGEHFRQVAAEVDGRFFKESNGKCVLDIGSNDGTQLKHYQGLGYDVLGVESATTPARLAKEAGVPTIQGYFNHDLARTIGKRFHVINAAGVFFHLEELHSVTDGIREALRDDGVFVVQFLYMKSIVENMAFDQIYHEHLLYYNLHNIQVLLHRHGLSLFDAYLSPIHGGSIIGFACHQGKRESSSGLAEMLKCEQSEKSNELSTYRAFSARLLSAKEKNLAYLEAARRNNKKAFGFGAPAKGNTLLNFFGIGPEYLQCLVEKNPLRRGLFSPGMHIPIVIEQELPAAPDIYYVLAWNFKKEILANNRHLLDKGVEFYFPVNPRQST
jgi:SAM-dependent methyltransferase